MQYHQFRTISGKGSGPEQFAEALRAIGVAPTDELYAVGDSEVKVFDSAGKFQFRWSTTKPGYSVTVASSESIWVGQTGQAENYDHRGKLLTTLKDGDRLGLVTAIGLAGEDILLADAAHRCIRRYAAQGKYLNDIGADNNTKGFLIPNGYLDLAVDAGGTLHVANPGKYRIERYTVDGKLLGHFGRFGTRNVEDFPGCCNPTNLALTRQGDVVVTEKAPARCKVYNTSGKLVSVIGPDAFDQNCKNMNVAVDSRGHIYVVDTIHLRVTVFASNEPATTTGPTTETTEGATRR